MHLHIDQYAHLNSPIHRWHPRAKFLTLFALIIAFSLVRDLRLAPIMVLITAGLYALSSLPLHFAVSRLRYPGMFLLVLIIILPLFTGQTVIAQVGPLSVRAEGVEYMLLVVSRFVSILTISLLIFGTSSFLTNVRTLRGLGIPSLLADMLLLTLRYVFEIAASFAQMQIAMRLRGFAITRLNRRGAAQIAGLLASLFIRSYEQAERVYKAMRLRGYGITPEEKTSLMDHTAQANTAALHINGLRFSYPGRPPALNGIDFQTATGERVGLIGPNGAGKTSLFLTICGVLAPNSGAITVLGTELRPGKFHPQIGMVFQNSDDQLFSPTVREDIAFGPVNLGFDADEIENAVSEALALTGTEHLADRAPHHLSGGEKRMVSIASVLATRPGVVLYDEPDANLDMRARRRLIEFLRGAPHTLILASHDLEMVLEVCDRVILLDDGQVVADGDPRTIMADQALMEAHGLEKPHSLIPHRHING